MKVFTVKKELLDVGKEIIKNSFGHEIPIYNRERTICDLVRSRSRFEIQDYQTALKTYIGGKGKDLNRLMEYDWQNQYMQKIYYKGWNID